MTLQLKSKTCRVCKAKFQPYRSTEIVCGWRCAIAHTKEKEKKAEKKQARRQKKEFYDNDRKHQLKECQKAFNTYIRERDKDELCISCGRQHDGQWHAGHYQSTGAHPDLRFHSLNNHKQCAPCNNHLSGNIIYYRPRLIAKIGQQAVDWLESSHSTPKLTLDDIKEIKGYYKQQLKILKSMDSFDRWKEDLS